MLKRERGLGVMSEIETLRSLNGLLTDEVDRLAKMHAEAFRIGVHHQQEAERLRADFQALQFALVGDSGLSAILEAKRLRNLHPLSTQNSSIPGETT